MFTYKLKYTATMYVCSIKNFKWTIVDVYRNVHITATTGPVNVEFYRNQNYTN